MAISDIVDASTTVCVTVENNGNVEQIDLTPQDQEAIRTTSGSLPKTGEIWKVRIHDDAQEVRLCLEERIEANKRDRLLEDLGIA